MFSYREPRRYESVPSYYKLSAISKAAGILSARKKSIKRGHQTKDPYMSKPVLASSYGFEVRDEHLLVAIADREYQSIPLNSHTIRVLSNPELVVRSFTLTEGSVSLCVSKEVPEMEAKDLAGAVGVDRNLRNTTVGNAGQVTYYDISKIVKIGEITRNITGSFKRDDVRVRTRIASKYGRRRRERTKRILNCVSRGIAENAKSNRQAIVFEEITGIRRLYQKGNRQGRGHRGRMNSWPFGELKRQVEYKAAWEGIPVVTLTRGETSGTTKDCPRCGERLQSAAQGDIEHHRPLWCEMCGRWMDRDLVAVLNISRRGWVRFAQSKGGPGEAVKGNLEHGGEPVILRIDASKSSQQIRA